MGSLQPTMMGAASVTILFCLATVISAQGPPQPYGLPPPAAYAPAPKEEAKPYAYSYAVADDYSKANFAANEASDAKVVTGSYTVHLPDGRVQTVTYTADHYNGYVADVKYEGTPVYPPAPAPKPYNSPPPPKYTPSRR